MDRPPSTTIVWPVMYSAAGDSRNSTVPAISCTVPGRRLGILLSTVDIGAMPGTP